MAKSKKQKWIKIIKRLLIALFAVFLLTLILLRLPPVQTFLATKITAFITNKTKSVIRVDKVAINFVDNICLKGIYIEDDNADTLLYADQLTVDLAFFKLIRNVVKIDNLDLQKPTLYLKQYDEERFNFTFLSDSFSSEEIDTSAETNIVFDLNTISIIQPNILAELLTSDYALQASSLFLDIDHFGLDKSRFVFDDIIAANLVTEIKNKGSIDSTEMDDKYVNSTIEFPLKDVPLDISINSLLIEESRFFILEEYAKKKSYFTSDYIDLSEFNFLAKDIAINENSASIDLKTFNVTLNDTIKIKSFSAPFTFTNNQLSLSDLDFKTPTSNAALDLKLTYDSFSNLINQSPNVKVDLNISTFNLLLREIEYFIPDLKNQQEFAYIRNDQLLVKSKITGGLSNLKVNDFYASIGDSELKGNGSIKYPMDMSRIFLNKFNVEATANYKDYAFFIDDEDLKNQLEQLGNISLASTVTGGLDKMDVSKLKFNSDAILFADLSGEVKALNNTDRLSFDLDINEIRSGKADMKIFMDSLPEVLDDFDTIMYKGNLKGTLTEFILEGGFDTSLGHLETKADILFNSSYSNATYSGNIILEEFQLGKMIDNDSLGNVSLQLDMTGSGISSSTINTKVEGIINSVDYNNYVYKDIQVNGLLKPAQFSGNISMNDENASLEFEGLVDMNDSIPQVDFALNVDTLDLFALNLYEEKLIIHMNMDAAFQGFSVDDIYGEIKIDSIALLGKETIWKTDSMNFTANTENNERGLTLTSDFLNASVTGNYTLAKLPETILDFMDQYFPLKTFLGSSPKEDNILSPSEKRAISGENISIQVGWHDVEDLVQIFDIPITRMDSSYFTFNLSAPDNLTNLELYIPYLNYDGYILDSIYAKGENTASEKIDLLFRIDSIEINPETHISDVQSDFLFSQKQARAKILVKADPNEKSLGAELLIRSEDTQQFLVKFSEEFYLNNHRWKVNQDSSIVLDGGKFQIPNIQLVNQKERFSFYGNNSSVTVNFSNFNLQNVTEIVKMDSLAIFGKINGDVSVDLKNNNTVTGDVDINNVYFNELEIGDFNLNVMKKDDDITSLILVEGESIQLESDIGYNITDGEFKGDIDLNKFNLATIDPFLSAYTQNVEGILDGNIRLNGSIEKPDVKGKINVRNASAYVNALETEYRIKDGVFDLYEDKISPNLTLVDNKKRTAQLSGEITHNYFNNMRLNILFKADEFTFLDSKKSRKADFYGKFIGRVDAKVTGAMDKPVVDAKIKALPNTNATLQLQSGSKSISNESYIIFYDGNKLSPEEAVDSLGKALYASDQGIEMNLDIQTDPQALFHVIVDPLTGDKLDIRGTSNILVKIPSSGDVNIVGDFTVSEGQYRLSYENTIKRNFIIDEGSKILFEGSPYSAQLDMRALYKTKTNTYALVNQMGTSLDDGSVSNRTTIEVVLNVAGTLSKPELSFDIQVPDNESGPLSNSVTQALTSLRQNETLLLEQVFSLILFNSFTGGSSGSNISSVGTATAVSSLGNLINNQLNKLAKNENGFKLNVDVDQYKDASISEGRNITEIGVGLEQSLFNDKLNISVGGNANLETGSQSQNNFSSFAGDFVIRYYLTDDKNMLVKVFQKSDYDALSNDSIWKTGIGLTYKKTFGNNRNIRK